MNSRIQTQANKLQQLVFNPATTETYKHAIALTWSIIKETGLLLWLVICLVLVLGDWFWNASYQTGQRARIWVEDLQKPSPEAAAGETEAFNLEKFTSSEFWTATGKSLLESGQSAATVALNAAKGQLGMEVKPAPEPKPPAVKPTPAPVPQSPSVAPPETATADSTTAESTDTQPE